MVDKNVNKHRNYGNAPKEINLKYLKIRQSYYSVFIKRKLNKHIKSINSPMLLDLLNEQDSPSNKVPIDGLMSKRTWCRHKQWDALQSRREQNLSLAATWE